MSSMGGEAAVHKVENDTLLYMSLLSVQTVSLLQLYINIVNKQNPASLTKSPRFSLK